MSSVQAIATAAAAIEAGDLDAALVALLHAWQPTRAAPIADAIDRVSNEITARRDPIAGKTVAKRQAMWLEVAKQRDPRDLGRLIATPFPRTLRAIVAMFDELLQWPADPRLATVLVRFVEEQILETPKGSELGKKALERIATLQDARGLPRLRVLADRNRPWTPRRALEAAVARLTEGEAVDPAIASAIEQLAPIGSVREQALIDAILAEPSDPAAYAVYGDWLSDRGDARGEFIALQLATDDVATATRQQELLTANGTRWAGSLDRWFADEPRYFERGFFVGGRLVAKGSSPDEIFADPMWRLVKIVELDASTIKYIDRPELAHVTTIGPIDLVTAERIANGPPRPIEELYVNLDDGELGGAFARAPALMKLRVLGVRGNAANLVEWLATAPLVERVERVVLTNTAPLVLDALASRGGELREVEVGRADERLRGVSDWCVRLSRDIRFTSFRAITATHVGEGRFFVLSELLDQLPADHCVQLRVVARRMMLRTFEKKLFEASVARMTNLVAIDVPWDRGQKTTARTIPIRLAARQVSSADTFRRVWEALARAGQRYDTFAINGSKTLRPLGKDPLERLLGWVERKMRHTELSNSAGSDRITVDFGTDIDLVGGERTPDQLAQTFVELVEILDGHGAMGTFGDYDRLELDDYAHYSTAGWMMALVRELTWQVSADAIRELGREFLPELVVSEVAGHYILRFTRDPSTASLPTLERLFAEIRALVHKNFVDRNGFDFLPVAREAFRELAAKHGAWFDEHTGVLRCAFRQGNVWFYADLQNAPTPLLTVWARERDHVNFVKELPIRGPAELAAALASASGPLDAWLTANVSR